MEDKNKLPVQADWGMTNTGYCECADKVGVECDGKKYPHCLHAKANYQIERTNGK